VKRIPPQINKRYDAFWAHEETDRAILSITVRDQKAPWAQHQLQNVHGQWDSPQTRYAWLRFCVENTLYYGEAIPNDWLNFGPGAMAAMMGSNYVLTENSVWFGEGDIFLKDWSSLKNLRLLEDSFMYRIVEDTTRLLTERNDGSYLVGISDLGGNLDILASLRDAQNLLMDLYDNPEMVLRAVEMIDEMWKTYYTKLRGILKASGQHGHVTWLGPWCETTYYPLQCDFAAMISPDHFERFVMPSLSRISQFLDHSIFHWDGPGQIPHLDQLLSLPRLDGIQWVPGDGNAPVWDEKWFPLYEKILAAGKSLVLHGFDNAQDALTVCKTFSPKGLWLSVTLDSAEEAEYLLKKAQK